MAIVYWVHLPKHNDMFSQGYIGVSANIKRRITQHKHKFKQYANELIIDTILIAEKSYCYLIEKSLRPSKNIGWNKAIGGYRNNSMIGDENPNYCQYGVNAPHFKGWYITPKGKFDNPFEVAKLFDVSPDTIRRRCKGINSNGKPYLYSKTNGIWDFEKKVEA